MRGRSVRLSFTLAEAYGGFASAEGIAVVTESGVDLEYEVQDGLVGLLKSGPKEVWLPAARIRSAEYKVGWFWGRLTIEAASLSDVSDIPGSRRGQLTLWVPRKERAAASRARSLLEAGLAREELEGLRRELDEHRSERRDERQDERHGEDVSKG